VSAERGFLVESAGQVGPAHLTPAQRWLLGVTPDELYEQTGRHVLARDTPLTRFGNEHRLEAARRAQRDGLPDPDVVVAEVERLAARVMRASADLGVGDQRDITRRAEDLIAAVEAIELELAEAAGTPEEKVRGLAHAFVAIHDHVELFHEAYQRYLAELARHPAPFDELARYALPFDIFAWDPLGLAWQEAALSGVDGDRLDAGPTALGLALATVEEFLFAQDDYDSPDDLFATPESYLLRAGQVDYFFLPELAAEDEDEQLAATGFRDLLDRDRSMLHFAARYLVERLDRVDDVQGVLQEIGRRSGQAAATYLEAFVVQAVAVAALREFLPAYGARPAPAPPTADRRAFADHRPEDLRQPPVPPRTADADARRAPDDGR